ncbi:MAG: B12-binding domain-containing radical SAM protein, partial [Nannocystaceae bacterium]
MGVRAPVVMAYPSPYRVGMSSLGFQTLYRILNEEGPGAHRAFLPDAWEPATLPWPAGGEPVLSYEAETPIRDYPILAVSVAYELEISGIIRLLEGAGVPLLAKDRGARDPVVIMGGPVTTTNPSLLLPFCDVLISGEAEETFPLAVHTILDTPGRDAAIEAAGALPHSCVGEVDEGRFEALPDMGRAPSERLPAYSAITTPEAELSNMFLVEPERGCSRRCTFCVMRGASTGGMRMLPLDVPLATIPDHAQKVGLVGAAVTDLPHLEELVAKIVETGRGVGISSLRADRLTPGFLDNLARGGYRTITVASDGISERMREVLDRKISEQDLLRAAELVGSRGFHRLKLYQMMGAPTEREEDADELVRFALELSKLTRLTMTFSTFVAKRNTPLDGQPFVGIKEAEARLKRIKAGLKGRVEIRPQPPKWAWVEYVLSQRGPEIGYRAIEAVHNGGNFGAWKKAFADLPAENPRPLIFGDEARRAARTG